MPTGVYVRKNKRIWDKDWLYYQYWTLQKNCREIAEDQNTSPGIIYRRLKEIDIATRPRGKKLGGGGFHTNPHTKEARRKMSEKQKGRYGEKSSHWKGGFPKCLDCGKEVSGYDHKRCSECSQAYCKGENSCNWKGGIGKLPYSFEFNDELKARIKERDDYTCQKCGNKDDLCVHHIDYDKQNCGDDNLITLCRGCNTSVNAERIFWTGYFLGKMENRRRKDE